MTIPDFMPVLGRGSHGSPAVGACVMEYISILAGEEFSDSPLCTHPRLGNIAISLNDAITIDEMRVAIMLPLIPRLMGTGHRQFFADPVMAQKLDHALYLRQIEWDKNHVSGSPVSCFRDLLNALLDEYDRVTGRTITPVSETALRAARAKVGI